MDLANCLGVNWLICGDFEPVDASAKCLFWFQKIKIEKQKIEKQLPGRGSLSGRTIIFGLGVSHGPFHLHYAWDLPEISGEAEKKSAHPSILHPLNVPVASFVSSSPGCVTGSKCPVVSLICKLPGIRVFLFIISSYFHFLFHTFIPAPSASY